MLDRKRKYLFQLSILCLTVILCILFVAQNDGELAVFSVRYVGARIINSGSGEEASTDDGTASTIQGYNLTDTG